MVHGTLTVPLATASPLPVRPHEFQRTRCPRRSDRRSHQ